MVKEYSEPFISVDSWINIAEIVITNPGVELANQKIIFIKTDLISQYIDKLLNHSCKFILITASNDDHCVPYMNFPPDEDVQKKTDELLNSNNLYFWYSKNVGIIHSKLKPLPLGPKWQWRTTRFFGESKKKHLEIYHNTDPNLFYTGNKPNLLYFHFNNTSNNPFYKEHTGIRHKCRYELRKNGFQDSGGNEFEDYMEKLKTYKFAVSPPGRGIQTHRFYESLMVGTIPIIIHAPTDSISDDLPVLFVNHWSEITPSFLDKKYKEITSKTDYKFEKLYESYWKNQISLDLNDLSLKA